MNNLTIKSNTKKYKVIFEKDFNSLKKLTFDNKATSVIDKNVYKIYSSELIKNNFNPNDIILFDAKEKNKTFKGASKIYRELLSRNFKKNVRLIVIGGGITQDVTGFVASTLYRGIEWYYIPTTLLSQADSCIGSKTSLNFETYKNILGTFYPPSSVHIYTDFLHTLSESNFISGIGEVIKLKIMKEEASKNFELIANEIRNASLNKNNLRLMIKNSLLTKISYIEDDEFDKGRRNLLNYGHCFGHAIEVSSNYRIPHGIAVIIGMIFANIVSFKRGLIRSDIFDYINKNIFLPYVKIKYTVDMFSEEKLIEAMKKDKKRIGSDLTIILMDNKYGFIKVDDLKEIEFKKSLNILIDILF